MRTKTITTHDSQCPAVEAFVAHADDSSHWMFIHRSNTDYMGQIDDGEKWMIAVCKWTDCDARVLVHIGDLQNSITTKAMPPQVTS